MSAEVLSIIRCDAPRCRSAIRLAYRDLRNAKPAAARAGWREVRREIDGHLVVRDYCPRHPA